MPRMLTGICVCLQGCLHDLNLKYGIASLWVLLPNTCTLAALAEGPVQGLSQAPKELQVVRPLNSRTIPQQRQIQGNFQ